MGIKGFGFKYFYFDCPTCGREETVSVSVEWDAAGPGYLDAEVEMPECQCDFTDAQEEALKQRALSVFEEEK